MSGGPNKNVEGTREMKREGETEMKRKNNRKRKRKRKRNNKRKSKRTRKKTNALFGIHMVFGMIENRSRYGLRDKSNSVAFQQELALPIKAL